MSAGFVALQLAPSPAGRARRASGHAPQARRRSPPAPRRRSRPCGCRCPRRSWLHPRPLRDRHGRPPALHRADRRGARHGDARQLAAKPGVARRAAAPPSPASPHWRPAGRRSASASMAASSTPASLPPPPMKIASGAASRRARRAPSLRRRSSPGTPSAAALRPIRAARSALLSMAMARIDGSASIHSIATEPAPAPMSHSNSPRRGASADKRERADLALGDLAVMLEQIVARGPAASGRMRAPGAASTSIATTLSGSIVASVEAIGAGRRGCARGRRPAPPAR